MAELINDGFTAQLSIPARGLWPDLTFRFRPALPETVYEYFAAHNQALQSGSGKKRLQVAVKHLLKQLISWDAPDPKRKGETVVLNEDNLKKIPASYIEEMLNAVNGYSLLEQEEDVKNLNTASE